jgi:hypothetical protein
MADATTAQPNAGGVNWPAILGQLAGAGIDIYSLINNTPGKTANTVANIADPLQPIKSDQLSQFTNFLKDPSTALNDPLFQSAQRIGRENISRQAGAADMASSGNRLADLFTYGRDSALGFEQQRFNDYMSILRPNVTGAGAYAQGQQQTGGLWGDLIKMLTGGGAGGVDLLPQIIKALTGGGGLGGGNPLTGLLDSGGINAGTLDPGGTLGDLGSFDFGSGGGAFGNLPDFFTGGSGDMFQMIDVLGG